MGHEQRRPRESALLLVALLVTHDQEVLYIPGRRVNRASDGYRGEGETNACDAYISGSMWVAIDQPSIRREQMSRTRAA
jgi:hypothetical protein